MKNLYEILGAQKNASTEDIKKAYFVMAKKYHPDSTDKDELEKFHEVTNAYKTLSDKQERIAYDLTLDEDDEKPLPEKKEPVMHSNLYKEKRCPPDHWKDDDEKP